MRKLAIASAPALAFALLAAAGASSLVASACSSSDGSGDTTASGTFGSTGGGGSSSSSTSHATGTGGSGGLNLFDGGPGSTSTSSTSGTGTGGGTGGGKPQYLIYSSTDTDLFTLDPTSADLALTHVGVFDCIGGTSGHTAMTDIAVDKSDALWGITGHDVVPLSIQGSTIHCGNAIQLTEGGLPAPTFYALTFAPVGVLDPAKEVLVAGNSAGELWAINGQTGEVAQHGIFGTVPADDGNGNAYAAANVGQPWELSGDIVFLANNGSPVGFATVRDCPTPPTTDGCSFTDTLLEIDLSKLAAQGNQPVLKALRGQVKQKPTGCATSFSGYFGSLYGIAAWDDKVYGFSRTGNLVQIDTTNGQGCYVNSYSPNNFSGAGVTTLAPVIPPPPIK